MKTHLPVGAAAAALAVVGLVLLFHPGGDPPPTGHPTLTAPSAPVSTPSSTQLSVAPDLRGGEEPLSAQIASQRKLVAGFARAFVSTVPQAQWIRDLEPYVSAELLDGLRHTDPRVRPVGQVEEIRFAESAGVFRVDYRGGEPILVHLMLVGAHWAVSGVEPVAPTTLPAGNDL